MKSIMKTSCLLAGGFLVFGVGTARADELDVKVPFAFVVNGRTLPAGQYRFESDATDPSVILIHGDKGVKAAIFVVTQPATGHDPAGDTPVLTFTHHETEYRLTDIWESGTEGREIARP
ncbi:MAG: hypothetical protein ND807_04110 [Vicinamibacterales bacterium]|nr:hypothetical protein [Vicinamibacterales bacterium]